MRQAVLLGTPDTKRTIYLGHAAQKAGLHVLFLDWNGWKEHFPRGDIVLKIDPPSWDSCSLEQLGELIRDYKEQLGRLALMAERQNIWFLNSPEAIGALLDKRECKRTLIKAGVPVTEILGGEVPGALVENREQLLDWMERERMYQVFIKPVYGSGAAGIAAFRWYPGTGKMVLYTCALESCTDTGRKELVNTKKLRRFEEKDAIEGLLDKLLAMDCIVERWYAKAEHQGLSYDLRVVVQDGQIDFGLGRLSKGPITNLHLNNHPLKLEELGLPEGVMEDVTKVCLRAMGCWQGLSSAGIDVLLEKGSLKPRVIEMNAQGDLIYQDIYGENRIYGHQVQWMAGKSHGAQRRRGHRHGEKNE